MCRKAGAAGGESVLGIRVDLKRAWGGGEGVSLGLVY